MKNFSVDERKILIIQGFDILAASLAGIFVTVFFFAHGDLRVTTLYNIAAFASMTFFFWIIWFTPAVTGYRTLVGVARYSIGKIVVTSLTRHANLHRLFDQKIHYCLTACLK